MAREFWGLVFQLAQGGWWTCLQVDFLSNEVAKQAIKSRNEPPKQTFRKSRWMGDRPVKVLRMNVVFHRDIFPGNKGILAPRK